MGQNRHRGVAINAAALRRARIDAHMSLADVAGESMTKQAVHLYETGRARPTLAKLQLIVERLGNTSVGAILADSDERRMVELDEQRQYRELGVLARAMLRELNSTKRMRAVATYYAGRSALNQAPTRALALFRRARRLLQRVGDQGLAVEAMDWEGVALHLLHDASAVEVGQQALDRYRALPDHESHVEVRMLDHVASHRLQRGEHAGAIHDYREAIEVAGSRPELARLAHVYHGLAEGCRLAGEVQRALDYMERAVHFYRTEREIRGPTGDSLARAEHDYGVQLMRLSRWEHAEEMLRASLRHCVEAGIQAGRAQALLSMGELNMLRGRLDEAADWTCKAIDNAERLGDTVALASSYQQFGELWAVRGEAGRFAASFERALEILDRLGLPERRAECLARYRRICRESQTAPVRSASSAPGSCSSARGR